MSTPSSTSKASRWSSLLQQAVAGVESRLDTILAETDDTTGKATVSPERPSQQTKRRDTVSRVPSLKTNDNNSRSRSNSKAGDRLQGRLARAVTGKDNVRAENTVASADLLSRPASPAVSEDTLRASFDDDRAAAPWAELGRSRPHQLASEAKLDEPQGTNEYSSLRLQNDSSRLHEPFGRLPAQQGLVDRESTKLVSELAPSLQRLQSQQEDDGEEALSVLSAAASAPKYAHELTLATNTLEAYRIQLAQMRSDYEMSESRRQDEVHAYSERVDALQAKLQFVSNEMAEAAKGKLATAPAGSLERKLAQQQEKIALLLEEGERLSGTELKHISTIKRLRAELRQEEKQMMEARQRAEKAENAVADLVQKVKRAEAAEKNANEKVKASSKQGRDLETLRAEHETNETLVATLRAQLNQVKSQANEEDRKLQTAVLEAERRLVSELRDDLSTTRIEKELLQGRHKSEIRGLKEKIEQEKERARAAEAELRREQTISETKLEALRTRAEEVAVGAHGDVQAKLIRQVETLQTQHAVSSENWQRIEESLMARVSDLEKERDELSRKEHDVRQKARNLNVQAKQAEEEARQSIGKLHSVERELSEQNARLNSMTVKADQLQRSLKDAHSDFEREREIWELNFSRRLEQEIAKWRDQTGPHPTSEPPFKVESPTTAERKDITIDEAHNQQPRRVKGRDASVENLRAQFPSRSDRRVSLRPPRTPDAMTISRQDSFVHMPQTPLKDILPETSSFRTFDQGEYFETHSSPQQTINDLVSVATASAGPSVQLVERMSAAVRRLNSERAAMKDELARVSAQRDEARAEVVELMREVEHKRADDRKIETLDSKVAELNERYLTTLEMLGEKSEMVEELRADIVDMKNIYRDLLDNTMK